MSDQIKYLLKPELRFPEFIDDGDWVEDTLANIATFSKGKGISKSDIFENGNTPCIRYGELYTQYNEIIRDVVSYTNLDPSDLVLSEVNDVLIPASGETQIDIATASCVLKDGIALGSDINIIRPQINGVFLAYYLNGVKKKEIARNAQGISVIHLYSRQLKTLKTNIPSPSEQQKIVSCLSSLDELIAAHNDKLDALKDHKRGLLQNLFPQEGETFPKVRFPEFENDGEWEPSTVEDNCLVKGRIGYRGYTKNDLVKEGEGALVLGGKNIQNQLLDLSDRTYLSWEKYFESPEIMVQMNHIIFSQRGTLGDCAIIDQEIGKATINPSMVLLRDITCSAKFLYYILIGNRVQAEVMRNSTSSAVPMLSQKQIREFTFLIPPPPEQDKIASTLSALDELLITQQKKIDELQEHKKGLMQGLFPKIKLT
ncbi:restriction endonuclease subunit S [Robiginitalea sediminis]|uniref:restriction endonuclease subunit S n=1 Tax=Robiginitalea sediminis TaxID=1982593 RepID=UPI000B4AFA25|nr:restriction endonuclease subunit S [Robiginitalea sediminis]